LSIHIALNHVTHYRYDRPVGLTKIEAVAGRLSDRLSLKHFSLIDVKISTVAA
jgi:hypothetical protein